MIETLTFLYRKLFGVEIYIFIWFKQLRVDSCLKHYLILCVKTSVPIKYIITHNIPNRKHLGFSADN